MPTTFILLLVIRSVTDILRTQSRFVKCLGVEAAATYNEFITLTTFILLVIRSVSDVLRAQSRLVKFVGGEAAGRTPYTFY